MYKKIVVKFIIIFILIILIVVINRHDFYKNKQNDLEKSSVVMDEYNYNDIKFEQLDYLYIPGEISNLVVKITNVSNNKKVIDGIKVISRNKDGKVLEIMEAQIYVELDINESFEYVFYSKYNILSDGSELEYIPNIV